MFDVQKTDAFDVWLDSLKDGLAKASIVARIRRLGLGNAGDWAAVGDGIFEMRVHIGPGYRVYYKQTGQTVVLLLCGGDKASQARDIRRAKQMAANL